MILRKFFKRIINRIYLLIIILFLIWFLELNFYSNEKSQFLINQQQDNDELNEYLKLQISDLIKVKASLQTELNGLESRKVFLLKEINGVQVILNKEFSNIQNIQNLKKIVDRQYNEELAKQIELTSKLAALIDQNILKFAANFNKKDHIKPVSGVILTNQFYSTLDSCFNFEKCAANSKIKIFFLNSDSLNIEENVDNVFQLVDTIDDACLVVKIISNTKKLLQSVDKIQSNLLIINSNDDLFYNLSNLTESQQKCSLYASFNYNSKNEILNDRNKNLFFHFSLITSNLNTHVANIYANQKQNMLLLTRKRTHLLAYYKANSRIIENIPKDGVFYEINCDIEGECLLSMQKRMEILADSSFLLIENHNLLSGTLWTNALTERLIEALSVGTIPLFIDLDTTLPLSDLISWDEVIVRVTIERINNLESILSNINQADVISRRIRASKIYNRYFQTAQIQFNTLLTAIRERLRMPATPIKDYVVEGLDDNPQVDFLNVDWSLYNDKINDNEYLGPKIVNLSKNSEMKSESYQFNLTFNSYYAWNYYFYPFHAMPSTPFDKFLPIDVKYSSINESNDDFYGGTRGGAQFRKKLHGNNDENEQFTIVILTFNRERLLINVILEYLQLPYLNQIIIVWNSVFLKPSKTFYFIFKEQLNAKMIRVVFGKLNSLGNRFLPYNFIRTDAILSLDDDTQLRNDEIIFAFRVWRENRDRLVGFPARFHSWDPNSKTYQYRTDFSCEYSLILTGAAMYHRFYNYYYHYILDKRIREKIDKALNCEDVAFNFMISDLIRKPPIKVTDRTSFYCKLCATTDMQKSLSATSQHYTMRTECINYFTLIYGYNPLLYSQSRMDSVLYRKGLPRDHQSCFNHL